MMYQDVVHPCQDGQGPIFATFNTTKGKVLKACTRRGMVFEWQKCTEQGLFFHMKGIFKALTGLDISPHIAALCPEVKLLYSCKPRCNRSVIDSQESKLLSKRNATSEKYCKSTIFSRYKIWQIYYFLGHNLIACRIQLIYCKPHLHGFLWDQSYFVKMTYSQTFLNCRRTVFSFDTGSFASYFQDHLTDSK